MKIGIDITPFLKKRKTGISWYTYYLVKNLAKIDKDNFYTLFGCSMGKYKDKFLLKKEINSENFDISVKMLPGNLVPAFLLFYPVELIHGKFDIIHILIHPYYCLHFFGKLVITFHDVVHLIFPEMFSPFEVETYKFAAKRAVKKANKIIAVSYSTKKDLIKYLNVKPEKIEVIHEGLYNFFDVIYNENMIEKIKLKYGVKKKYILSVGTIEPKKNHIRLLNAFVKIKKKINDYQLIICGKPGWKAEEFYKRLSEINDQIKKDIIVTNYIPLNDLTILYKEADIFVYPSLYEGFGFPILEAMNCGVPVITSNISSMPEVAGDAALLINPEDEDDIANAILKLVEERELRKDLIKKGLERVKLFTWENTAKKTLKVYKELM
ncbi:MAG: glycosyltransferase family 4 protein [Candidatus Omnitrophica bacterium]|nr:glycosyltransferase family 4 protein [Candidatus Omnitrophota bacterium]MCM8802026.1 glycosyltransferase family 4 protein [Candidatus Omnitrophota bacterium]